MNRDSRLTKKRDCFSHPRLEAFYGLSFSRDGTLLLFRGGSEVLHDFVLANGYLNDPEQLRLRASRSVNPGGFAVTAEGDTFMLRTSGRTPYAAPRQGGWRRDPRAFAGGCAPAAFVEPAPARTILDHQTRGRLCCKSNFTRAIPLCLRLDEPRARLYVSLWGQASVAVIDTKEFPVASGVAETTPNEMLLTKAAAICLWRMRIATRFRSSNREWAQRETLIASCSRRASGQYPNALALTPDEKRLFVANANINTVAVFDVQKIGRHGASGCAGSRYPTSCE